MTFLNIDARRFVSDRIQNKKKIYDVKFAKKNLSYRVFKLKKVTGNLNTCDF